MFVSRNRSLSQREETTLREYFFRCEKCHFELTTTRSTTEIQHLEKRLRRLRKSLVSRESASLSTLGLRRAIQSCELKRNELSLLTGA